MAGRQSLIIILAIIIFTNGYETLGELTVPSIWPSAQYMLKFGGFCILVLKTWFKILPYETSSSWLIVLTWFYTARGVSNLSALLAIEVFTALWGGYYYPIYKEEMGAWTCSRSYNQSMPGMGFELGPVTLTVPSQPHTASGKDGGMERVGRETGLQCEVLGGLEPFGEVSRPEVAKAAWQGQVRTFISGSCILPRRSGGENTQSERHH